MSRRFTKEELDEQFEQFLKESVSDDSIDLGSSQRPSVLDSLGKAAKKETANAPPRPWWNSDDDDNDVSSGRVQEPRKSRFTKVKKPQAVHKEAEAVFKNPIGGEECRLSEGSTEVSSKPTPKVRSKALDKLNRLEQRYIAKKEASSKLQGESNDTDSQGSGDGMLGTGKNFLKSVRSSQPIKEEDEDQKENKPGDHQETNPVSFSRDSLEPEESVVASGPDQSAAGFGMDTLDEEEEKARFFAKLESGVSSTIDYSKLNKELDSTGSTVIATLRNGEKLLSEEEHTKEVKDNSKSTPVSPNYSEDFEDDTSEKEGHDQLSIHKQREGELSCRDESAGKAASEDVQPDQYSAVQSGSHQKSEAPAMLAKVSLLDSLESTAEAQKRNITNEKADKEMENTEPREQEMTGTVSYGQSGASDMEALHEAYRKINYSFGDSDGYHEIPEHLQKKNFIVQTLESTRETAPNVTTTESDMPTAEELMKPIGVGHGFARGFALQPVSESGCLAETIDEFSHKISLMEHKNSEDSILDYFSGGPNKENFSGILRAREDTKTVKQSKIADEVDHLMKYAEDSKVKRLPRHSSPVLNKNKTQQTSGCSPVLLGKSLIPGPQTPSKQIKSPQTKNKKTVSGSSQSTKSYGFSKSSSSVKQSSPASERKTLNQGMKRNSTKHKSPADPAAVRTKGGDSQALHPTQSGLKMNNELIASVQSFAAFLQQQIDRNPQGFLNSQFQAMEHSQDLVQEFPGAKHIPRAPQSMHREISLLKHAEEAQERWSSEHVLVEELKAQLIQKEKELKNQEEELKFAHSKEVFNLKQENYILQTKLHSVEEANNKKNLIFAGATDPVTEDKLKLIEKELKEQEILIQGYHRENEKLYRQVKELQNQNKLNEDKMFKENQRLMTELASTKEQITRNNLQKVPDNGSEHSRDHSFTELLTQLRAAQGGEARLMEEVRRLKQDKQSLELDLEVMKKERDLAKAQAVYVSGDKTFEMKVMGEKYNQEIADLKKRLQWYAENQELLDKDTMRLQAATSEIEKLKEQVEKLKAEVGNRNIQQQRKMKERVGDAKRIQDLERQVKEMEEIIRRRHPNSLPALIYAAASAGEGGAAAKPETVTFLEKRVQRLEAELQGKDEEAKRSLRAMEQQYHKIKIQYEQRISELEQLLSHKLIPEREESDQWAAEAGALGEELKQLREAYQAKEDALQREIETLQNQLLPTKQKVAENCRKSPQRPEKQVEGTYKIKLDKLNQEVAAKNKTIQELSRTVEKLQKERRSLLSRQTGDGKVCPSKLHSSQMNKNKSVPRADRNSTGAVEGFPATWDEKDYQPHAFAGSHISEVLQDNERLEREVERLALDMDQQRVKLQAAVAQAECEARRTQEETAEYVSSLKAEHQKELEHLVTHHALEHSSSKVAELSNKVSTQEIMIRHLRDQVSELQKTKEALAVLHVREETLQTQMAKLLEELREAKEAHTPELKHFSALERKIKNMEIRHLQREQELQQIIEQTRRIVHEEQQQEVSKWKRLAQQKTGELEAFRVELDSILDVLRELQRQGVVIPAPHTAAQRVTGLDWRT
ncbi:centrosomal protein of 162 kDa isoform X2 [Lepisosteus oculatus]|uniref:centrosomal protein of 162 kDa isoform X2 n=1 Tax=Lepisosteus oculatus TaxID=7918 RepID=UPI0035F51EFB